MGTVSRRYGATDGFVMMPDGTTHYIFGFVDITGVPENMIFEFRGRAQLLAFDLHGLGIPQVLLCGLQPLLGGGHHHTDVTFRDTLIVNTHDHPRQA